jgi:uncharacterized membrane protein
MMEAYLHDWLSLLLRWAHFITGVAWIGASFYFNWLENHLERQNAAGGIAGDLWAVHGGGFYHLEKYEVAPETLPPTLHWFKYEAYFTWITGLARLCTVYYWNAGAFLIDRSVADISSWHAITIGLSSMVLSWIFYDFLCRSPLQRKGTILALLIFAWFVTLAWLLSEFLSGRAAYIHVGAAIGTIMVANVAHVIIPAQRDLVAAVGENRKPDGEKGKNALLRSRHNNYFTLPVLFIMISNHYAGTFGHPWNWLVLVLISIAGVGIRHWFNIRHLPGHNRWILPVSMLLLAGLIFVMRPQPMMMDEGESELPTSADVMPIIQQRCVSCHAEAPVQAGFTAPPLGIVLDNVQSLEAMAPRVYQSVVVTRTMPLGNLSDMTDEERDLLTRWYAGLDKRGQNHE